LALLGGLKGKMRERNERWFERRVIDALTPTYHTL
jgi:hypothetical protein